MSYGRPVITTRLQELLDGIRAEFENVRTEALAYRLHKDESDHKFNQQTNELQKIKQTVFDLEAAHRTIKDAYELEIYRLKKELDLKDKQLITIQALQAAAQQAPPPPAHQAGHPASHSQGPSDRTPTGQAMHLGGAPPPPPGGPMASYGKPPMYGNSPNVPPPGVSGPPPASNEAIGTPKHQGNSLPSAHHQQNGTPLSHPPPPPGASVAGGPPGGYQGPPPLRHHVPSYPPTQQHTPQQPRSELAPLATGAPIGGAPPAPITGPPPAATSAPAAAPVGASGPTSAASAPVQSASLVPASSASSAPEGNAATTTGGASFTAADTSSQELVKTEPGTQLSAHNKAIPPFLNYLDVSSVPAERKKQMNDYYVLYNPAVPRAMDVELVHSLDHNSVVCCVRFSADGKYLATGCNKTTQVYSVETGELVARLLDSSVPASDGNVNEGTSSGDLYIRSVCFSPDGKFLATGAEDKLIRIWDLTTRRITKYLKGHEQDIYSLDFFPDGRKLVSGSGDRTVRIWDLTSGLTQLTLTIEDGVTTVAVSPDGKLIAAGSLDRTVRVWDAITGFLVERLDSENENDNGHKDSVYSVMFTGEGKQIASGSLDTTVKLWSLNGAAGGSTSKAPANCEITYVGHKDFVLSVCASPRGKYILSGSKDRGVIFWEKTSGTPLLMLQGHRNSVISVSVSANPVFGNGMFATGSGDCKARIWKWFAVQP